MINPFKQLGDLKKMRDQAMEIQKQLQAEEITVEKNGVKVVISGDQKIRELESNDRSD
ncbi:YbaB/EbfC family nucleoid-associated protein, partial [Candidatus Microgenomates bacterium]|nr:YbaB/EbfC family nucleoid-associated protein [Candidatus Microgenomates bacterium]